MLELDGSFGEGGGQILRTCLALSLVTGKAFHLRNVRARRAKPGLQPQHLMSVRAAAAVGQAEVRGDSLRSGDLVFQPGSVVPGKYQFDIGTAGEARITSKRCTGIASSRRMKAWQPRVSSRSARVPMIRY